MAQFKPPRNRDAWAAIRGYVYQVDLTILRWLSISVSQVLEVECGEDIDVVTQCLSTDEPKEKKRLLEQVKARNRNLTLRSDEAVAALANALETLHENPSLDLSFCFTTNAIVGRERGFPELNRQCGLDLWQKLRSRTGGELDSKSLGAIKSVLRCFSRPAGLADHTWKHFRSWADRAEDSQVLWLIDHFTWSTGVDSPEETDGRIRRELRTSGAVSSDVQAEELYGRLFLAVFRTLTKPGRKRLTKEQLTELQNQPSLSSDEQAQLQKLRDQFSARISTVETSIVYHDRQLNVLGEQLASLAREQQITASVAYSSIDPLTTPPLRITHGSLRNAAVQQLDAIVKRHTWTAIRGEPGAGKTQLALSLVDQFRIQLWVPLRDTTGLAAVLALRAALATHPELSCDSLFGQENLSDLARITSTSVLVVDDLPRLEVTQELSHWLQRIARSASGSQLRLLSLSHFEIPRRLRETLATNEFGAAEAPTLSESDARDILISQGAEGEVLTPETIRFLTSTARNHIATFTAVVRYLKSLSWKFSDAAIANVSSGVHTAELNSETLTRLFRSVNDSTTLELLFRLNLVLGRFTADDAMALAAVEPTIERPSLKLNELKGLWVQAEAKERFSVATLVKHLGACDLQEHTVVNCYLALGDRVMRKGSITQYDAHEALLYFVQAKSFERAGVVFAMGLASIDRMINAGEEVMFDAGLLTLWKSTPLPVEMSLNLRLMIRSLQVGIASKRRSDFNYVLDDIDRLLSLDKSESTGGGISACFRSASAVAPFDTARACKYTLRFLRNRNRFSDLAGNVTGLPRSEAATTLVWLISSGVKDIHGVRQIFELVASLDKDDGDYACRSRTGMQGCLLLTDMAIFHGLSHPTGSPFWHELSMQFQQLAAFAVAHSLPVLCGAAVQARLGIRAEFLGQRTDAIKEAQDVLAQHQDDPHLTFILGSVIGEQLLIDSRIEEARHYLEAAMNTSNGVFASRAVKLHLLLSRSLSDEDSRSAVAHAHKALALAKEYTIEMPELEVCRTLGETAIAEWKCNGVPACFPFLSEAIRRLLDGFKDMQVWKALAVTLGHTSGYLTLLAATGSPPETTSHGDAYAAPRPGLLFKDSADIAAFFDEKDLPVLAVQMATFADAIGSDQARDWAMFGMELAERTGNPKWISTVARDVIPWLVLSDDLVDALETAIDVFPFLNALALAAKNNDVQPSSSNDIDKWLGPKESNERKTAEYFAAIQGFVPSLVRLCLLRLESLEKAIGLATELAAKSQQVKESAASRDLWTVAEEVLVSGFVNPISGKELVAWANGVKAEFGAIGAAAYLIASFGDDARIEDALQCQLASLPMLCQLYATQQVVLDRLLSPFVAQYWVQRFRQQRFSFRNPQLVGDDLEKAFALRGVEKIKATLRAVTGGASTRLNDESAQWLR